jgi:hypothetical protein
LVEWEKISTTASQHSYARFLLKQDQITPRIARIQRHVKSFLSAKRKERLHLLSILSISNQALNIDIFSMIASML